MGLPTTLSPQSISEIFAGGGASMKAALLVAVVAMSASERPHPTSRRHVWGMCAPRQLRLRGGGDSGQPPRVGLEKLVDETLPNASAAASQRRLPRPPTLGTDAGLQLSLVGAPVNTVLQSAVSKSAPPSAVGSPSEAGAGAGGPQKAAGGELHSGDSARDHVLMEPPMARTHANVEGAGASGAKGVADAAAGHVRGRSPDSLGPNSPR